MHVYISALFKRKPRLYICERTKDEYDITRTKNDITVRGANIGGYLDDVDETISSMNHL